MNKSTSIASLSTAALVLGFVIFRLIFAASQVAVAAGLGRGPKLPKSWQRWLFDERSNTSNS